MPSLRSLRNRAQTGLRRQGAEQRRRVIQAWRDVADLPSELGQKLTRPTSTLRPIPVEVPIRRR